MINAQQIYCIVQVQRYVTRIQKPISAKELHMIKIKTCISKLMHCIKDSL